MGNAKPDPDALMAEIGRKDPVLRDKARDLATAADCTEVQALLGLLLAGQDAIEARGGATLDGTALPPLDVDFLVADPADRPHVQRARDVARRNGWTARV